jgi:hypothetical protein
LKIERDKEWDSRGKFALCSGVENAIHRLLKYPESQRWREEL